jgi:hypothetical protein
MRQALLGIGLGVLGFALACELVLRLLPVSTATMTGYRLDPLILTYPPQHTWTAATGWDLRNAQTLRSNNLGFPSERDFVPDPRALVLVGDSYVEASMLPYSSRPGPQLERALGGTRPVYAMGGPGSSLLDYAERVRYAHQTLGVRDFVLLIEPGDIRQVLCNSGNVHGVCIDPANLRLRQQTLPPPTASKQLLRHSALAQYLNGQLKLDLRKLARSVFVRELPDHTAAAAIPTSTPAAPTVPAVPRELAPARAQLVDVVAAAFFARLQETAPGSRLVIVADGQRDASQRVSPEVMQELLRFLQHARELGMSVVEGQPLYGAHQRQSTLSLSVGPYDGHLNALGVQILMEAAARSLR